MTLSANDLLAAIGRESDLFRAALADLPSGRRVPGCPEWDADDLLWHLAEVQWFWATTMRLRPAGPDAHPDRVERPADRSGLLAAFDAASTDLRRQLTGLDPAEPAWSWAAEQTVGFTLRRQAHEALIHRVDAEQTAGVALSAIDAALAADGVRESLDVMYGGEPPEGVVFRPVGGVVGIELGDLDEVVRVQPGELDGSLPDGRRLDGPHLLLRDDAAGEPAARVRGTAAEVDLWLWKRLPDGVVERDGDPTTLEAFLAAISPSID